MAEDNQDFSSGQQAVQFIRDNYGQLADVLDRLVGVKTPENGFFPPSSDWLGYQDKNVLIRLDVAIYALHLAMARVCIKPLPHVVRTRITKTKQQIEAIAAEAASFFVLSHTVGLIVRLGIDLLEVWKDITEQRELEQSIRSNVARTQRELNDYRLGKGDAKRYKYVHTRH